MPVTGSWLHMNVTRNWLTCVRRMQLVTVNRAHFICTNHKARCYCDRMLRLKLETQNQPNTEESLFKIRKVKNTSGTGAAMMRPPVRLRVNNTGMLVNALSCC